MSGHWLTQRERGTVFAMKLITWIAFTLGRRTARVLLYPICVYFMLFAHAGVRSSRQYHGRVLGRPARWREVFRHHLYFASVLLDRAFVLAGRKHELVVDGDAVELARRMANSGQGCLIIGAHMGSFDVTRKLGDERLGGVIVNMMMYEENAQKLNAVIASIGGRSRMKVIPIGGVDSLIRAKERLDAGEWVAILGDRVVANDRLIRVPFLGGEAAFPAGPFLAASALKVPVVLFACLYLGGNRYREHFELLTEEMTLERRNAADLQKWVALYAQRLEYYCRLAPYNWFNFYDFWASAVPPEPKSMAHNLA